jgi:hypothetical protein
MADSTNATTETKPVWLTRKEASTYLKTWRKYVGETLRRRRRPHRDQNWPFRSLRRGRPRCMDDFASSLVDF